MEESNIGIQKKRVEQFLDDLEFSYKQLKNSHPQGKKYKALLECMKLLDEARKLQQDLNGTLSNTSPDTLGLIGHLQVRFKKNVLKINR
ncbi:MAG: hypothetical protein QG594_45 [Bacteroidota bacterium]|nr:hypothetical protein [Bacteroidota bacterium]